MYLSERLLWIFAILFLLFGMPLLFLNNENPDTATARLLAGAAALCLSGFAFCLAWSALEKGEIKLQHFQYKRATQPRRFVASVTLILIAGVGTFIAAVWTLLFK